MMEEVSDDTNGESTFEFVNNKNDETCHKVINESASPSLPIPETIHSSAPSIPEGLFTSQVGTTNIFTSEPIVFYDPAQHMESFPPNLSEQPLLPPPDASFENQFYSQQQSNPGTANTSSLVEPSAQMQHSALTLPPDDGPGQDNTSDSVWGWLKGKSFLNRVAEKAKSSVDTVITTLDPGMKEIINTGGDINVIVASGNDTKVSAVREAFQSVFGKATVQGVAVQSSSIAPQPVGFSAALKAAEERISNLRQQGFAHDSQIFLAIENFLAEITPENWFDMGCLLLQDFNSGITLQVYTEAIPVPSQYVLEAKEQTSASYPLGWSGFAVTVGQLIAPALGVHHSEWQQALTGVSRREILLLAARTLAGIYKAQLNR